MASRSATANARWRRPWASGRLGRGGGSYDRVLARLGRAGVRPVLAVLLYEHELLERVPAEPHDLPVDLAVTPSGVRTLG